tara:strand:+ start:1534 stop:1731 length:198 start_codon:yes stop_codon:yes gene_type:complete
VLAPPTQPIRLRVHYPINSMSIKTCSDVNCNNKKFFKNFTAEELKVFLYFARTVHNPFAFYSRED